MANALFESKHLKYGRYLHAIERYVLTKRSSPGRMFAFLSLLLLGLTVVLNIGSIPTMQQLLENLRLPQKFLTRLYTAGYAAYVVFSPYDAGIQMILLFASTTYSAYCFGGILMASVILTVSSLLVKTDRRLLHQIGLSLSDKQPQGADKGVSELLVHIGILIGLAFLADRLLPFFPAGLSYCCGDHRLFSSVERITACPVRLWPGITKLSSSSAAL